MKNTKFTILPLLAVMGLPVFALPAAAEVHPAHSRVDVKAIGGEPSDTVRIYETFAENSPTSYHIPDAPRFAIVGKDRKFYLGIGGQVKGVALFDWGDPIQNPDEFVTSAIPMNKTPGNGGELQMTARQSGLFVNFVALPDNPNKVGVFMAANLIGSGDNYSFNLQYAYVKYRGFTIGYDYTLFGDMGAAIPTIDYEGPNSFTAFPNAVVDYRHNFGKFQIGVGAELPTASYTTGDHTSTVSQRVPDIPAYVQYSWTSGSWIRFSALMRNMAYRDLVAGKNNTATGWGVKVSGTTAMSSPLRAYWQVAYGKGMTSYFQDLYDEGLDMVPDSDSPGKLDMVKSWGGYFGLQYNFSSKVYSSVAYSHVRNYFDSYKGGTTPWGEQYKYAQYAVGNVIYNVNSIFSCGLEYLWGRRVDMSGLSHHDNRIQAMVQVTF